MVKAQAARKLFTDDGRSHIPPESAQSASCYYKAAVTKNTQQSRLWYTKAAECYFGKQRKATMTNINMQ